jgi:periplasmic copper chaperone A
MKNIFAILALTSLFGTIGCGKTQAPPQAVAPAGVAGTILISEPRIRAPVNGSNQTAAYLTLTNNGTVNDALVGGSVSQASAVELHTHLKTADGLMAMRKIKQIDIPPQKSILLSPGGLHLMIKDLKGGVKVGDSIPLTLNFASGASANLLVPIVLNPAAKPKEAKDGSGGHVH